MWTLDDLVSSRTGLVRSVGPVSRGALEPDLPKIYNASLAHFDFRTASSSERAAAGKGSTDEEARLAAIAEAVERYCGWQGRPDSFRMAALEQLEEEAIAPTELALYSAKQYASPHFPYRPYDPSRPIAWVRGWKLPDRSPIWLPANFVYLNWHGDALAPPDSSGLAAGPDMESAIMSGLFEVLERDAFVKTWLLRLPGARIEPQGAIERDIVRHYARFGVETRVYALDTRWPVTVAMALAIDRSGKSPAAVVGLGCHSSPEVAARKALFELCQVRPGVSIEHGRKLERPDQVRSLEDHAAYYAVTERLGEFSFLDGVAPREQSTGELVARLTMAGHRVAFIDITTRDLSDAFPIHVVRVVVTRVQPIHFGYGMERYGPEIAEKALNPAPHPLA